MYRILGRTVHRKIIDSKHDLRNLFPATAGPNLFNLQRRSEYEIIISIATQSFKKTNRNCYGNITITCAFLVLIQNDNLLQNKNNRQIITQYSVRGVYKFVLPPKMLFGTTRQGKPSTATETPWGPHLPMRQMKADGRERVDPRTKGRGQKAEALRHKQILYFHCSFRCWVVQVCLSCGV